MPKRYEVFIGTGTAAGAVSSQCRSAGWSVAVIDSRPFGGTCALRGCDPKKVLVGAAEAIDSVRRLDGKALTAEGTRIDLSLAKTGAALLPVTIATSRELVAPMLAMVGRPERSDRTYVPSPDSGI